MWKALIKLVEKWACCHEWELHRRMRTYGDDSTILPWKVEETLICKKCGKIKKISYDKFSSIHNNFIHQCIPTHWQEHFGYQVKQTYSFYC